MAMWSTHRHGDAYTLDHLSNNDFNRHMHAIALQQVTAPLRLVAALQHLAAGIVLSAIAVELVPVILAAPNSVDCTIGIAVGFISALMVRKFSFLSSR